MDAMHYAKLVQALDKWMEEASLDGHPELVYDTITVDMAKAAVLVYDSCMRGQTYAEQNG